MANIFEYLNWRGDLSLAQSPFNAVDGLILSQLAYIDFEGIVAGSLTESPVTIADAAKAFKAAGADQKMIASRQYSVDNFVKLFARLAECDRFSQLRLVGYVNSFDSDTQKQFAAITVLAGKPDEKSSGKLFGIPLSKSLGKLFGKSPEESLIFVSYRGTDNTLVGWKEDFNMSFLAAVPSQLEAVAYLKKTAAQFAGRLQLGGHSKGGNLAVYASACSNAAVQDRIDHVYSFDGPGFAASILTSDGYLKVRKQIHSFMPQSSIVGLLMEHDDAATIVHSTEVGINQHDAFSWEVTYNYFVCLDSLTDASQRLDRTLTDWLKSLNEIQRQQFIDGFYEVLAATQAETLNDLTSDWFKNAGIIIKSLKNADLETKQLMMQAIQLLFKSVKSNMPEINPVKLISNHFQKQPEKDTED
jgi:hypothetical protein